MSDWLWIRLPIVGFFVLALLSEVVGRGGIWLPWFTYPVAFASALVAALPTRGAPRRENALLAAYIALGVVTVLNVLFVLLPQSIVQDRLNTPYPDDFQERVAFFVFIEIAFGGMMFLISGMAGWLVADIRDFWLRGRGASSQPRHV